MTTVVLGLDGAAFELVDRWIEDRTLPTLARLVDEGAAADMQSCVPPVTCPNWQCYATGMNPGKLGVFWWERVDLASHSIENTSTNTQFDGRYYWKYFDGQTATINLPTSYPPPDEVDGVHIAGGPGSEQSGYTTPKNLEQELLATYDYTVHPEHMSYLSAENPDSPCVDEIYDLIETRFDVLESYVTDDDTDFVHCTIFYLNVLQHFYWDDEVVREAWERIDDRLADLLATDELETLYVMSDHGSNEIETAFLINVWLERQGYLETTTGLSDVLHRAGLTRERIRPVLGSLGVEWWLRKLVPRRIQMLLPDAEGSVTEGAKANVIDWENSVALASGQGPLYVLEDDPEERRRIRDELLDRLDGLAHDDQLIVEATVPAEEVYDGPYLDQAPDIVLRQAPGIHIEGAIGRNRDAFESPSRWRGENKETGLFVAHGPDIDPNATLEGMHILDVAPTVLHHTNTAVPTDLDGEVRTDLFTGGSGPASRDTVSQPPVGNDTDGVGDPDREVSDRLSDLGYLQ